MNVLVACEYSGIVRDAFRALGHNAWSCDLLPTDAPSPYHMQGDVFDFIREGPANSDKPWHLMIAHPPCTYLCNSGVRWLYTGGKGTVRDEQRWTNMLDAVDFFTRLQAVDIRMIAIENPRMHRYAKAGIDTWETQTIQPWQFGHGETKATVLHLKNLPPLTPTKVVSGRKPVVHHASPGPLRWKLRSTTYQGIAAAMAQQWGGQL